jgi:hypothetical protein
MHDAVDFDTCKLCTCVQSRRANADYATPERDAKRAQRADADQKNAPTQSGLCDLRTRCEESAASRRGPFKRDAKRARRADASQKKHQPNPPSGCVFICLKSPVRPSVVGSEY